MKDVEKEIKNVADEKAVRKESVESKGGNGYGMPKLRKL